MKSNDPLVLAAFAVLTGAAYSGKARNTIASAKNTLTTFLHVLFIQYLRLVFSGF